MRSSCSESCVISLVLRLALDIASSECRVMTIVANIPATTVAISASAVSVGTRRLRGRARRMDRGDISVPSIGRKSPVTQFSAGSPGQRPDSEPLDMNVLIVDDEPGTRLLVASAIERLGHHAAQAADGTEGWRVFQAQRPDVVITDWAMPGLDGTELTARIRSDERGYTYIVVLSGRADEEDSREAMRAGADHVLAKPPDAASLERALISAERVIALHARMSSDARRDVVTDVGSRLRLEEALAALCARVKRYGHAYCVAMIGLDPGDDVT